MPFSTSNQAVSTFAATNNITIAAAKRAIDALNTGTKCNIKKALPILKAMGHPFKSLTINPSTFTINKTGNRFSYVNFLKNPSIIN